MLLRQLNYFISVVETGSFTEAAERCHISQSAVSQQIQALERELGVELLHRKNRSFALTAAGEHFYRKGRSLLDELNRLCRETAEIAHKAAPRLRVGCLRGYSGLEFHLAVAEFTQDHPEVLVEVFSGSHEDLYDELKSGRADFVLSDQRRTFSDAYVNQTLTTNACCVELSAHFPLAVPVYFYSMAAQMKIFIDRCFPRYTEIKNKQFYFIVTAADPQHSAAEATIAGLRGFLRCLPGAEEKGVVYGTGAWDKGDALRHPAYEKAFKMDKSV